MAKNNPTAAAKKLFLAITKSIEVELLKPEVSGPTGNDKQFKAFLYAVKSVISHVEEGTLLFAVDSDRSFTAASLARINRKRVLEKERATFTSNMDSLITAYVAGVKNSSKEADTIENTTVQTIEVLCTVFRKRGLVSDSCLKRFELAVSSQTATA